MNLKHLMIRAELNGDREQQKIPKVSGAAYTGGKIDVGWDLPIVVDFEGLVIPKEIPLLADHENKTLERVGVIAANVENYVLYIAGSIISETAEARNIVSQGKLFGWQLSIGADPEEAR